MSIRGGLGCVVLALCASACSSEPGTQQLARQAIEAMGGDAAVRGVQNFVMRDGSGARSRLGQNRPGEPDRPGQLRNVVETLDLAGGRAALDYEITTASGFSQHRQEIVTNQGDRAVGLENVATRPLAVVSPSGLFSWGTQNSPLMTLRRNVITLVLAAADAEVTEPPQDKELNGRMLQFGTTALNGESVGVYFDPATKLIAGYETTDTETMLGDVTAQYLLDDYRDVNGVRLPHRITITKAGEHYADVQFASASINDAEALRVFDIPAAAAADVERAVAAGDDYSPVTLTRIADGVHFAQGYSHHSLVVEFPAYLAVVEAPYTEAQSKTLANALGTQFPGKPIRYAVATHPHYDHIGGLRGIAAQGATIVAAQAHGAALRAVLEAPHSNPADDLATRRKARQPTGAIETFEGRRVIGDGDRTLELYTISGSPHVEPMVIAFVPRSGILFQSDIFFPGTGGTASPDAIHLLQSVRALKLPVRTNAGGHGGVAPFEELVRAAAAATN